MARPKGSTNKPKQNQQLNSQQQLSSNPTIASQVDDNTFLLTSQKYEQKALEEAMLNFTTKSNFRSTYFNEQNTSLNISIDDIDNLALNAQTNLNSIMKINNIVRYFINKNDVLGKTYEALETNVNSQWELIFPKFNEDEKEMYNEIKIIIENFNKSIDLDRLVVESIPMTFIEANYIFYLRKDIKNKSYQIDYYPLGVADIADYNEAGEPYILIDIYELKNRLQKIYKKDRKNKPLFYKDMDEEVQATYPKEVYNAYINKERYAVLDIKNTGVMRINNLKRKYGLSPVFKALKPSIRLENIELSDDKNTLVRGKKIIFQKLREELVTKANEMPNITWSSAQAKAHSDLMGALSSSGVTVFTAPPWTEEISYIESKLEPTNAQIKNQYRDQIMQGLGISYLSATKGSYGSAEISIKELMKLINRISEQLEKILHKFYMGLLHDLGYDVKFAPKIKVIDSEQLEMEIKLQLVEVLFNKLSCSYESAYKFMGLNAEDEFMRRKQEKEDGYEEVFAPHLTSYTSNGDSNDDENKGGTPIENKNLDRKEYDENYNEDNNR